jgi:hypothetical protein
MPIKLGRSGGNARDSSAQGGLLSCCGGTLGSLVQRNGTYYILSNNHVIQGVGVTLSANAPGEAALMIFVIRGIARNPIPVTIDGLRTRVRESSRFTAGNRGNEITRGACRVPPYLPAKFESSDHATDAAVHKPTLTKPLTDRPISLSLHHPAELELA